MSSLKEIFLSHKGRSSHRFIHGMEIYDEYFSQYRDKEVTIVEVGVAQGGGLQIWKKYFGSKAKVYGIDVNESFLFKEEQIEIFIGNQKNRSFLKEVFNKIGSVDILIDDGEHEPNGQIATFEESIPYIKEGGLYVCEDLHNAYHPDYINNSFMDYLKNKIDFINIKSGDYSIHFYTGIVIIKKDMKNRTLISPVLVGEISK